MTEPSEHFMDIAQARGRLVWKYKFAWSFSERTVLLNDRNLLVMEHISSSPFSSKPDLIGCSAFEGAIEWESSKPLWKSILPWVRRIETHILLRSLDGELLTRTSAVLGNPVHFTIGSNLFAYERITRNWRRKLVVHDSEGEIITGEDDTSEMQVLRQVESFPTVLAVYWALRLCEIKT